MYDMTLRVQTNNTSSLRNLDDDEFDIEEDGFEQWEISGGDAMDLSWVRETPGDLHSESCGQRAEMTIGKVKVRQFVSFWEFIHLQKCCFQTRVAANGNR